MFDEEGQFFMFVVIDIFIYDAHKIFSDYYKYFTDTMYNIILIYRNIETKRIQ